ncbi:MAG: class I adenylate cyclase [Gammaproteobacteria bacterium]|nr:class I adenylate cyclase [Gammaproteobacteria bacterium]
MLTDARDTVTATEDHGEKRFLVLNRDRLRRVQDSLTPRQRDFLEILPLLFHINHPLLPGYVSKETPAGINDYGPTEATLRAVRRMCRSFDYDRRQAVRFPIRALYMMGSPGTIAYTRHSDLDMWLCHDPELPAPAVELLAEKARRIETFAAEIGLEVHFFVLDAERFRAGETLAMSDESSGSSQHSLLLDEFYRSSLLVAGLRPLWWRVPSRFEADYQDYVREAAAARRLDVRDYIDFGGLASIPVEEFFGAAVWQLYKSIKSPYKSVLKLLLMEAYAAEYPRITLLSQRYKRNIESEHVSLDSLDPYILMYTKVEEHLMARNDPVRLDVLRRSFYIKANLRLSTRGPLAAEDWRADVLGEMVKAWGWSWEQVSRLDQREAWRIDTAVEERRDLINTLKDSYAMLSQFARNHANDHLISGQDLHVLGRQLYAAFERKPAKIEVVTRGICSHPQEASLSLHEVRTADSSLVWMLFAGTVRPAEVQFRRPLKRSASAAEILVWCHLNRLSDPATTWHVFTQTNELTALEIKRTNEALATSLAADDGDDSDDGVRAKPRIARVTLLVNVGVSTFSNAMGGGGVLTSTRTDAFQFGARRMNLVRAVDLVFGTTWGETYCYHYEGNGAVLEALAECLNWNEADAGETAVPPIVAHCFTSDYAAQIAERVAQTFGAAYGFLLSHAREATPHYIIEIDDQLHHLRMQDGKPQVEVHGSQTSLVRALAEVTGNRFNTVHFDGACLRAGVLPQMYAHNRPGRLQIFARQREHLADVYILDERGLLLVHRQECYSMPALLHHYRRFIEKALPRCGYDGIGEEEPGRLLPVDTFEIMTAGGVVHLKPHADQPEQATPYLSIQVLADADSQGHQQFTINANHREFSTWEHGGSLFVQVAEFVLSQRRLGEVYPIYITDLDLSPRFRKQIGIESLRPLDLLNYKKRIEFQLTRALLRDVAGGGSVALAS